MEQIAWYNETSFVKFHNRRNCDMPFGYRLVPLAAFLCFYAYTPFAVTISLSLMAVGVPVEQVSSVPSVVIFSCLLVTLLYAIIWLVAFTAKVKYSVSFSILMASGALLSIFLFVLHLHVDCPRNYQPHYREYLIAIICQIALAGLMAWCAYQRSSPCDPPSTEIAPLDSTPVAATEEAQN